MKTLFIILGSLSLALGIIGMFLPLLPTTPFLLLTAALYIKSSPRLYDWLISHRILGEYIRNFRRKPRHTAPCKDNIGIAAVGDDAVLHIRRRRQMDMGATASRRFGRSHNMAYSLVRHTAQIGSVNEL